MLDKDYKVRATPEQSKQIQELFFELGGKRIGGSRSVHLIDKPFLFIEGVTLYFGIDDEYFYHHPFQEILAPDLIALLQSKIDAKSQTKVGGSSASEKKAATFKAGDRVYCPQFGTSVYVLKQFAGNINMFVIGENYVEFMAFDKKGYSQPCRAPYIFHATPENRDALQVLFPDIEFEAPPKPMRKIGEWEYPEPERYELEIGQTYFMPCLFTAVGAASRDWQDEEIDRRALQHGLVHARFENAVAHAKALILASGGRIDE